MATKYASFKSRKRDSLKQSQQELCAVLACFRDALEFGNINTAAEMVANNSFGLSHN